MELIFWTELPNKIRLLQSKNLYFLSCWPAPRYWVGNKNNYSVRRKMYDSTLPTQLRSTLQIDLMLPENSYHFFQANNLMVFSCRGLANRFAIHLWTNSQNQFCMYYFCELFTGYTCKCPFLPYSSLVNIWGRFNSFLLWFE